MSVRTEQIEKYLSSKNIQTVSDAIVGSALLLEWHKLGFADEMLVESFTMALCPRSPLKKPTDHEAHLLIKALKKKLNSSDSSKFWGSLIWALGCSKSNESILAVLEYINQSKDPYRVCENTSVLWTIFYSTICSKPNRRMMRILDRFAERLSSMNFSKDDVDEEHRIKLINKISRLKKSSSDR